MYYYAKPTMLDILIEEAEQETENYFQSDKWNAETKNKGGVKGLWQKIKDVCLQAKVQACKALGLDDKHMVRSCINKLRNFASTIIYKIKSIFKNVTPKIKEFCNKVANFIMDAIDYIKSEFE